MNAKGNSELFRWLAAVVVVAAIITAYVFPVGFLIALAFAGFTVIVKLIIDLILL